MTDPLAAPATPRTVRELLVRQQRDAHDELPLPRLLRTPSIVLLWAFTLSTVVAALALARVRVPRRVHGVVLTVETPRASRLTALLVLPASVRRFVRPGQLAAVDTGGSTPLVVAIASASPQPVHASIALSTPPFSGPGMSPRARADTATVAVPLERCRAGHCLPRSGTQRFAATATLGTRSLASFALPRS